MSDFEVQPFVVACTPIRSRAWIVREHFESLALDQPKPPLGGIFYLTGDNEDHTLELLQDLECNGEGFLVRRFVVEEFNTDSPFWSRDRPGERYTGDDHLSLSRVYNHLIDRALDLFPEATHLWLTDSDVLPEPGCLAKLLAADKDVIAPVVEHSENAFNFILGEGKDGEPRRSGEEARRVAELPPGRREFEGWLGPNLPFPATFVSCCVLYRREVLEALAPPERLVSTLEEWAAHEERYAHRFAPHPRSHDFPMMASLRAAGVELRVHPLARAEHRMVEPAIA